MIEELGDALKDLGFQSCEMIRKETKKKKGTYGQARSFCPWLTDGDRRLHITDFRLHFPNFITTYFPGDFIILLGARTALANGASFHLSIRRKTGAIE